MGTRAVYTFKDQYDTYAVYKHWDGYPSGAAEFLENALPYAWQGERFEAADLAAAFVAANKKTEGGDVYFTKGQSRHGDLDYDYVVTQKNAEKWVTVYSHEWNDVTKKTSRKRFWSGPLLKFIAEYKEKKNV